MCGFCVVFSFAVPATGVLPFFCVGRVWAHREGSPGFRDRSRPKTSLHMPLRLMAVRSGHVSSVPKPMCGPGGVADDVFAEKAQTSYLCEEQRMVFRIIFLERRVKRESLEIRKRRWRRVRRRRESRREEEVVLKKTARWRLRKKRTVRKSWMSRGKVCRNSCGTLRSLRAWSRWFGTARKKSGRISLKRLKERGHNFCWSTTRCRSCRVCKIRSGIKSKRLVFVRKKCGKSMQKWRKEVCVSRPCLKVGQLSEGSR